MVVRIRMQRFGQRNLPFYRIVIADSRAGRDGRFIEKVANINLTCTF
jgi:small subunit ribosomal protein S16